MLQQENEIAIETDVLMETSAENTQKDPTPSLKKTDILIDVYQQREKLKLYRRELEAGIRRPSNLLKSLLYTTQKETIP